MATRGLRGLCSSGVDARFFAALPVKVFIAQAVIDAWVAADRVDVSGPVMSLRGSPGAWELRPASWFVNISAGSDEAQRLLGKVKDEEAVAALGGEAYMSSVIVGETAYEVQPGFLATPAAGAPARPLLAALHALAAAV